MVIDSDTAGLVLGIGEGSDGRSTVAGEGEDLGSIVGDDSGQGDGVVSGDAMMDVGISVKRSAKDIDVPEAS